jgi:hypothetical protein
MKNSTGIVSLALLTLFLVVSSACAGSSALTVPERLVYDVSWTGIKAGTAVQEVTQKDGDLHIVSTVHSASWINPFFPVDDRTESVVARGTGHEAIGMPKRYYEKINEGSFHTLKEAHFDPANLKVTSKDHLKKSEKTDPITAKTFDSLSCVYFVRTSELEVGKSLFVEIYDFKRMWNTEVQVVRKEELKTDLGTFKTIVVQPLLKSDGFFARTGAVTVWLTDDERRVPVKMTTKVKLGKITATLVGGSYWPKAEAR